MEGVFRLSLAFLHFLEPEFTSLDLGQILCERNLVPIELLLGLFNVCISLIATLESSCSQTRLRSDSIKLILSVELGSLLLLLNA